MKKSIQTLEDVSNLAKLMLEKANDHAKPLESHVSCLCGLVLAKADKGSIRVSERNVKGHAHIGTRVWFAIKGTVFSLVYHHHSQQIALKEGHKVHCYIHDKTNLLEFFKILEGYADGGSLLLFK